MLRTNEKRKFPRLNAYHLVKYRLASWPPDKGPVLASIRNISAGGMQIVTDEPLPLNSVFEIYISFPYLTQPVPCKAKTVWMSKINKINKFRAGLEFIEIDELCRTNIAKHAEFINRTIKERD